MMKKLLMTLIGMALLPLAAHGAPSKQVRALNQALQQKDARWVARDNKISLATPAQQKRLLGAMPSRPMKAAKNQRAKTLSSNVILPSQFDWRNVTYHPSVPNGNYVSKVRNQGGCGSCVLFATTAGLETKIAIQYKTPNAEYDLSEQVAISCAATQTPIAGWDLCGQGYWVEDAMLNLTKQGLPPEANYPYKASNGKCAEAAPLWEKRAYKIKQYQSIYTDNLSQAEGVQQLKQGLYLYGPLVTRFNVYSDFFSYAGGVYKQAMGSPVGGHAVTIVGWSDPEQAFIVKNSWGEGWGESGYFKIGYSELKSRAAFAQSAQSYGDIITPSSQYQKTLPQLTLRGSFNNWGNQGMTLVGDNLWQADVSASTHFSFKFDVYQDWKTNFGDTNKDNIADPNGSNINVNLGAGLYRILFNDKTRFYTIQKLGGNQAPVAHAGADINTQTGQTFSLNGSQSKDPEGKALSYAWALPDGRILTGATPSTQFNNAGDYVIVLTVTDDAGAKASDSVVVSVSNAVVLFKQNYPSVFLRGTTNNWASSPMQLVGHNEWRIQASFAQNGQFKFDIQGDWKTNFGDNNKDGLADSNGSNISITQGAGLYEIRFNDLSKRYSISKISSGNTTQQRR